MLEYKNYIFDLYGTLIDITTDENDPVFWAFLADLYSCYGSDYKPRELQNKYLDMVREEEMKLAEKTGILCPEIKLEVVFARLLKEAKKKHECMYAVADMSVEELIKSQWVNVIANAFRIKSRLVFKIYPHVYEILKSIKEQGGKIYMLSNAQAVFTRPEIEVMGLSGYFDAIYLSSDCGIKKPGREFMQLLMKEQGLKAEESVMVGNDIESDVCVAARSNMKSIYLNTYNLDRNEIEMHTVHALNGADQNLMPRVIFDGDFSRILD